jgi:ankyrin repeat domain-containing protein 50
MERLGQLPAGLDALYGATFSRIESQPEERAALAKRILMWLVYAQEPLSTEDMRYAVADDPEYDWLHPAELIEESMLLSACCGLVMVEESVFYRSSGKSRPKLLLRSVLIFLSEGQRIQVPRLIRKCFSPGRLLYVYAISRLHRTRIIEEASRQLQS